MSKFGFFLFETSFLCLLIAHSAKCEKKGNLSQRELWLLLFYRNADQYLFGVYVTKTFNEVSGLLNFHKNNNIFYYLPNESCLIRINYEI